MGSGRRPLLYGNQKARNTSPPVQMATLLRRTATPSRGITSRLMTIQHRMPAINAGRRIHMLAVLTFANSASTS